MKSGNHEHGRTLSGFTEAVHRITIGAGCLLNFAEDGLGTRPDDVNGELMEKALYIADTLDGLCRLAGI